MDPTEESAVASPPADPAREVSSREHDDRGSPRHEAPDGAEPCLVCVTAADRRRYH